MFVDCVVVLMVCIDLCLMSGLLSLIVWWCMGMLIVWFCFFCSRILIV